MDENAWIIADLDLLCETCDGEVDLLDDRLGRAVCRHCGIAFGVDGIAFGVDEIGLDRSA